MIDNKTFSKTEFRKALFALALPLSLEYFLNALVGASDALMLGRLTQEAVAAVSLANQISFVMNLFLGATIGGSGVLVAQYYGQKNTTVVKRLFSMAIRYSFLIGVIFFLLALLIPNQLMMIFTTEENLIEIGSQYLRIVSFSYLFSAISQCYRMVMKVDGRAKMSVAISLMMVLTDMSVDFFLIYGMGLIPALGANGSAYSTIVVEALAFIWCLIASFQKDKIRPSIKEMFQFSSSLEKDMMKIGLPMLASSLCWGLSISVHSALIGRLGIDITAAYSVTAVVVELIQCMTRGFASGLSILIGGLLGQGLFEQAKAYGHYSWFVGLSCGLANTLMILIFGPLFYFFYILSDTAKGLLIQMLIFNVFYMFAYAFNTVFTCGVFPAGGDSRYDAVSVFFATWCFAIPLAFVGWLVFQWPSMVVYILVSLDEIIKIPALILRYRKYIWLKQLTK